LLTGWLADKETSQKERKGDGNGKGKKRVRSDVRKKGKWLMGADWWKITFEIRHPDVIHWEDDG
jgi:hypothetical protein